LLSAGQSTHRWTRQGLSSGQKFVGADFVFARFGLDGVQLREERNWYRGT